MSEKFPILYGLIWRNETMIGSKMRFFVPIRPSRRSFDEDEDE